MPVRRLTRQVNTGNQCSGTNVAICCNQVGLGVLDFSCNAIHSSKFQTIAVRADKTVQSTCDGTVACCQANANQIGLVSDRSCEDQTNSRACQFRQLPQPYLVGGMRLRVVMGQALVNPLVYFVSCSCDDLQTCVSDMRCHITPPMELAS